MIIRLAPGARDAGQFKSFILPRKGGDKQIRVEGGREADGANIERRVIKVRNPAGEREVEEMTGSEELKLIEYLQSKGWTAEQILELIKYIKG